MSSFDVSEIDKFIGEMNNTDIENLDFDMYGIFDYAGFDPYAILGELMKVKKDKSISNDVFKDDILYIIMAVVKKGSITQKNKDKVSDSGKAKFDELIKKYNLKFGAGRNSEKKMLTFSRIANALPFLTVDLYIKQGDRFRYGAFGKNLIPVFARHQTFAACIPQKDFDRHTQQFLLVLVYIHSCDVAMLTRNEKNLNDEEKSQLVANQNTYITAAFGSSYPNNSDRLKFMYKIDFSPALKREVFELYEEFRSKYLREYPSIDGKHITEFLNNFQIRRSSAQSASTIGPQTPIGRSQGSLPLQRFAPSAQQFSDEQIRRLQARTAPSLFQEPPQTISTRRTKRSEGRSLAGQAIQSIISPQAGYQIPFSGFSQPNVPGFGPHAPGVPLQTYDFGQEIAPSAPQDFASSAPQASYLYQGEYQAEDPEDIASESDGHVALSGTPEGPVTGSAE